MLCPNRAADIQQRATALNARDLHPRHSTTAGAVSGGRFGLDRAARLRSRRRAPAQMQGTEATQDLKELLVVGPGVLGSCIAKLWIDQGGRATGRTNTNRSHSRLEALGVTPETWEARSGQEEFSNVVYCAPPSGSTDYAASVRAAVDSWSGSGSFVLTSSTGVYPQGRDIDEEAPTMQLGESGRVDRLLLAEEAVLEAGGNVVRLAGLYHSTRGPHSFYIAKGTCSRPPNHMLRLIHYEDAASFVLQVLLGGKRFQKKVFLAVDAYPVTAQDLVDLSLASGLFEGTVRFEQEPYETVPSRMIRNDRSVELLGGRWSPMYTFESLMKSGGNDWYRTSKLW